MGHLLSVFVEGFLDFWCFLRGKQRELEESSTIGQSEFEKEGPGFLWAAIIGIGLVVVVVCIVVFR